MASWVEIDGNCGKRSGTTGSDLIADEKTVKMCAERFNWGVGTVFTTAEQVDWKGDSAIGHFGDRPQISPKGWLCGAKRLGGALAKPFC